MPKYGPERGLAQADRGPLSQPPQGVAQADRRGGLAFALRRGRHGGDQDQVAVRAAGPPLQFVDRDLGDVVPVRQDALGVQAQFGGHFVDPPRRDAVVDRAGSVMRGSWLGWGWE